MEKVKDILLIILGIAIALAFSLVLLFCCPASTCNHWTNSNCFLFHQWHGYI